MMKKISLKLFLIGSIALLTFAACGDNSLPKKHTPDAGVSSKPLAGICKRSECPEPAQGIACCAPNAACGTDVTGLGLGCVPNPDTLGSGGVCDLKKCKQDAGANGCCTPLGECGTDPFGNGIFCFPPVPAAPPLCPLDTCPAPDGGAKSCCQLSGDCGLDLLGIGLCFPPPVPLCPLDKCPAPEGGIKACCQLNGKCGVDALGIGLCFPPPPKSTCDLSICHKGPNGIKACCQPDGTCGWDSLNIGLCFPPLPAPPDGGFVAPPVVTTPPDDPSIDRNCPSFIGLFGPQWGCCSPYGVCGTFLGNQCSLGIGAQIPNGPPPAKDAGKEPFLRCTPPPVHTPDGG